MPSNTRHQCIIYTGNPSHKLPAISIIIQERMQAGYQCLYINSPSMVKEMKFSLESLGIDIEKEMTSNRLVFSSEGCCEEEDFDIDSMLNGLESALDQALKNGFKGLWASGDMTWELGAEKNYEKLVEYEWKLEQLFQRRKELHGICQYHCDTLPQEVIRQGLLMHHTLFINDTLSKINPLYNPELSTAFSVANPILDKMISDICGANIEENRRSVN